MTKTVVSRIKDRIIKHGHGWCFTPKHFLDLDSDTGVRSALSRLQKEKFIRRLTQGIYEYPRQHPILGLLPPKAEAVANAIAEKNGIQIQPTGAYAANLIGLSEQVPGRIVFLTNGPSKKVKIGKQEIIFRTTTEKNMYPAGTAVGLAIQALKNIGQNHIDHRIRTCLRKFLADNSKQELINNLKYAPQWIRAFIFNIMELKP
jgi:Family of unknown function (DUF6088)